MCDFLLLLLLFEILLIFSPCTGAPNAPEPIARYSFTAGCKKKYFHGQDAKDKYNPPLPPFVRDKASTRCSSEGIGIESLAGSLSDSTLIASPLSLGKSGVQQILQPIQELDQGVSFEFWLKPMEVEHQPNRSTIFLLGYPKSRSDQANDIQECSEQHFDFRISHLISSQGQNVLEVVARLDTEQSSCTQWRFQVQPYKILHIVIAMSDGNQEAYVNGQALRRHYEQFSNSIQHWRRDSTMSFFSGVGVLHDNELWPGRLYQFSIYDKALSQEEARRSLASGLSDGQIPFSPPYQIVLNEDAEALPGSHHPDWYRKPYSPVSQNRTVVENDLQTVPLRVQFANDQVEPLLMSLGVEPTFNKNHDVTVLFYVISLPSRGKLYHFIDGQFTEVSDSNHEPILVLIVDPSSLIFLPDLNDYSSEPGAEYTSINYCMKDHIIFDPAQCESSTAISIVVERVNDPPIAIAVPNSIDAVEGQEEPQITTSLTLLGTDVDAPEDNITSFQIVSPPRWGTLVLRVTSFREDHIPHGTNLSSVNNFTITSQENEIRVKYVFDRYDEAALALKVPGTGASDFFQFRVSDSSGVWSKEETVQVNLLSAVTAARSEAPLEVSGESSTGISLSAADALSRPLAFLVSSLPDERFGSLRNSVTGEALAVGSIVDASLSGNTQTALFSFQPWPAYCNFTHRKELGSFSYIAVARAGNTTTTSASRTATQKLQFKCKSYPIEFTIAKDRLELQAFGLGSVNGTCGDDFYDLSPPHSELSKCDTVANVEGLQVRVPKQQLFDPVYVTVQAGNGFISFTNTSWNKLEMYQGRRVLSKNVTFGAVATDLESILSGLSYRSRTRGEDIIQILTQHGGCIVFNGTKVKTNTCHRARLFVAVHVVGGDVDPIFEPSSLKAPYEVLLILVGYPIMYLFLIWFLQFFGICQRKESHQKDPLVPRIEWYEFESPGGHTFYINVVQGKTSWHPPRERNYILRDKHDFEPIFQFIDERFGGYYYISVDEPGIQTRSKDKPDCRYFCCDDHDLPLIA